MRFPLSTFSADAIAGLAGPAGLAARRADAAERLAAASLPSTDEEVWRYSRIDELDLDGFTPGAVTSTVDHGDLGRASVLRGDDAAGALGDLPESSDALTWLHHALAADPIVIDVPAGVTVADSIVVRHQGPADAVAAAPQLVVRAGADSEVRVVEVFEGGGAGLLLPATSITLAGAARVGYVGVQQLDRAAWSVGTLDIEADAQASVTAGLAGFGGDYTRVRTDCRLVGRGATGDLLAAYFGDGDQTLDYRTFQDHVAPDTTSNLLFKGTVSDRSRSVYTGLIRVAKDGAGHQRLPDQPQHQALRGGVGRVRAQPPDREQRRALQPRVRRRADRRGAALLPREPRRAHPGRRAPHRRRVLRRGVRPAARQRPAPRARRRRRGQARARCSHEASSSASGRSRTSPDGKALRVEIGDRAVVVVRIGDDVYALGDRCSHQDISLSEGEVDCDEKLIECWKHGSAFSLVDRRARVAPGHQAGARLRGPRRRRRDRGGGRR